MTPEERRQTILAMIAAELELHRAAQCIKKSWIGQLGDKQISPPTVAHVLAGRNHKLSTLIDVADALGCDVEIVIHRRSA